MGTLKYQYQCLADLFIIQACQLDLCIFQFYVTMTVGLVVGCFQKERDRQTDRQRDRQTEIEREDRERETETDTDRHRQTENHANWTDRPDRPSDHLRHTDYNQTRTCRQTSMAVDWPLLDQPQMDRLMNQETGQLTSIPGRPLTPGSPLDPIATPSTTKSPRSPCRRNKQDTCAKSWKVTGDKPSVTMLLDSPYHRNKQDTFAKSWKVTGDKPSVTMSLDSPYHRNTQGTVANSSTIRIDMLSITINARYGSQILTKIMINCVFCHVKGLWLNIPTNVILHNLLH